ncbi:MAG: CPBP family intramembrane metalloprotease [Micrococcales bacterium]|nr:CPBP family intramembrane metalloprotease [Micrococcales bacterium]
MVRDRLARIQLPLFFVLAYAITWSAQITTYLYADAHGIQISNEDNLAHFQALLAGRLDAGFTPYLLLFHLGFGPSVAGILVVALVRGRAGLGELFRRVIKVRVPLRWVLVIVAIPLVWSAVALGLGYLASGFAPIKFDFLVPLSMILPFFLYMVIFTGLSEEVGWRGYALPELQSKYSAEKSSWILGILWGLWHLPSVLLVPFLHGDLTLLLAGTSLLGLTLGIVGWTIVITWVYNNTGSVFWMIILHGFVNTVQSYLVLSSNNDPAMAIWAIIPWAFAIVLLKKYGGQTLTGQPKGPTTLTSADNPE